MAAFAKQDTSADSNGAGFPWFEFFLGRHAVRGDDHLLQMDRGVFICDEGPSVAVGED